MKDKLARFDIFAKEPKLKIAGVDSFKTSIGGALTIVSCLVYSGMTALIFHDFVRTDIPTVIKDSIRSSVHPKYDLLAESMLPVILPISDGEALVTLANYKEFFTITATRNKKTFIEVDGTSSKAPKGQTNQNQTFQSGPAPNETNPGQNQTQIPSNQTPQSSNTGNSQKTSTQGSTVISESYGSTYEKMRIEVVSCADVIKDDPDRDIMLGVGEKFQSKVKHFGLCLRPIYPSIDNITVEGDPSSDITETVRIQISPCSLASGCRATDQISKVKLMFGKKEINLNMASYSQPTVVGMNTDIQQELDLSLTRLIGLKMVKNEIQDDRGMFGYTYLRSQFVDTQISTEYHKSRNASNIRCEPGNDAQCDAYLILSLASGGETITY